MPLKPLLAARGALPVLASLRDRCVMTRNIIAAILLCAVSSCAGNPAFAIECRASHYGHGDGFHGRKTASGERFDKNALTAAMRTHDWRYAMVTNLHNGRSVRVRINDFGPAKWTGKCIDLSYGAAAAIGMGGVARVRVD